MCDSQCAHLLLLFVLDGPENWLFVMSQRAPSACWGFSGCRRPGLSRSRQELKASVYVGGREQMFNMLLAEDPSLKAATSTHDSRRLSEIYRLSMLLHRLFFFCALQISEFMFLNKLLRVSSAALFLPHKSTPDQSFSCPNYVLEMCVSSGFLFWAEWKESWRAQDGICFVQLSLARTTRTVLTCMWVQSFSRWESNGTWRGLWFVFVSCSPWSEEVSWQNTHRHLLLRCCCF